MFFHRNPEILDIAYGILSVAAMGYGARLYQREPGRSFVLRLSRALLPVGAVTLVGMCFRALLQSPYWPLNPGRLVSTFALKQGVLYSGPDVGPLLVNQYGPVSVFAYWPVIWTSTSTRAVLLGVTLAMAYFFLPVFWVHRQHPDKVTPNNLSFVPPMMFLCWSLFVFLSAPLAYVASSIHSDAPLLGLGAMACALIYRRGSVSCHVTWGLSALCVVLALWTKQTAFPLVAACLMYVGMTEGIDSLKKFMGYLVIWGILWSGLFLFLFRPADLYYCVVTIMQHFPLIHARTGLLGVFWGEGVLLLGECRIPLIVFVFLCLQEYRPPVVVTWHGIQQWLRTNRWALFFLVAIFNVPFSLFHKGILAADINAFADTLYYLSIAVSLALVHHKEKRSVQALLCAALLVLVASQLPSLARLSADYERLKDNPLRQACLFVQKHPGEVYFPMDPLTTFMTEGRFYHYEVALYDMDVIGFKVSPAHLSAYLPPHMKWIAYSNSFFTSGMKYFPEFKKKVEVTGLPGWTVYSRS